MNTTSAIIIGLGVLVAASNLGFCENAREPKASTFQLFEGVISGKCIIVEGETGEFDPSKHKIVSRENSKIPEGHYPTIDGYQVRGTDGLIPPKGAEVLAGLRIRIDGTSFPCPESLLTGVFSPHKDAATFEGKWFDNVVIVSADAKSVVVRIALADGGATDSVSWTMLSTKEWIRGEPADPGS